MTKRSLVGLIAALIACGSAQAASGWVVIGHASGKGSPPTYAAVAVARAKAHHARQIAVRVSGPGVSGIVRVTCTRGSATAKSSTQYRGSGTHLVTLPKPVPSNWPTCKVFALAASSMTVSLKILKR